MNKEQLVKQIKEKRSFLCVGLDSDIKKMPACIKDNEDAIFDFNKAIIDATAPYTVAYKPNLAFYEAFGVKGWISFEKTVKYIKENYPEIFPLPHSPSNAWLMPSHITSIPIKIKVIIKTPIILSYRIRSPIHHSHNGLLCRVP